MKQQELEKTKEYKYGFTTDIESIRAPKGLNEEVIKFIFLLFTMVIPLFRFFLASMVGEEPLRAILL